VHRESIDMDICWYQSRYDKVGPGGTGKDYINCPMDEAQYNAFIDALIAGDTTGFKEWEGTPYFDGCLPIEVMAERGRETLRHGPMKPMGLTNAHHPTVKPYAVVQLRQDNARHALQHGRLPDEAEIWRAGGDLPDDPGLGERRVRAARRAAPQYLHQLPHPARQDADAEGRPGLRFAGQITGCEGYVESASIGLLAGRFAAAERKGARRLPPETTAFGALLNHITGGHLVSHDEPGKRSFQPMNINFGLFPPLEPGTMTKPEGAKRFRGKDKAIEEARNGRARAEGLCRLARSRYRGESGPVFGYVLVGGTDIVPQQP
jgi:methylenetetrahydrofolate--tRNA-(uracil-5-)-methyltransferase